ncbi:hypothetical protein Cadr_000031155 [Camelus dromedarius]|uniref:Uncharacterized protein n=1 Tax=Camelus dromedarius TaxID=9838 RepID=A0A5N4BX95_CAMDR|nr:hypothetical protein Cadr_000031155 [Camelus dromedarius]
MLPTAPASRRGFCIHRREQPPRGPKGAEDDADEGEGSGEGSTAAQGLRRRPPGHSQDPRLRPSRPSAGPGGDPPPIDPGYYQRSTGRPAAGAAQTAGPEPRRGPRLTYLQSRPRGRGTTLAPRPSPSISVELEEENKESGPSLEIRSRGPLHATDPAAPVPPAPLPSRLLEPGPDPRERGQIREDLLKHLCRCCGQEEHCHCGGGSSAMDAPSAAQAD